MADIGIYSLAYKIGMMISELDAPFQTYWTSQMYVLVRGEEGRSLFSKVLTNLLLVMTFGAVLLTVLAGPVLAVLATPAYFGARLLVPYIAGVYVIRSVADHFRSVFYIKNRPDLDAKSSWISATVCLVAYAVFIPWLKVWGAVMATFFAFATMAGFVIWRTGKLERFPIEWTRVVKIAGAAAISVVAYVLLPKGSWATDTLTGCLATALFPAVLLIEGFAKRSASTSSNVSSSSGISPSDGANDEQSEHAGPDRQSVRDLAHSRPPWGSKAPAPRGGPVS